MKSAIPAIEIDLYDDQMEAIEPLWRRVSEAANAGKPGIILAQVFRRRMFAFFIEHDRGLKFQELMGQPVGRAGKHPPISYDEESP